MVSRALLEERCILAKLYLDGTTVYDALEKGFDDLMGLCNVVIDKFTVARDAFDAEHKA